MIPPALIARQTVRAGGNHLWYTSVPPSVVNHTSAVLDVLHHQHTERVSELGVSAVSPWNNIMIIVNVTCKIYHIATSLAVMPRVCKFVYMHA